jgi:acyl dehydratase
MPRGDTLAHGTEAPSVALAEMVGLNLGSRVVRYEAADAILYALAVGTSADEIEYTYERDLRVLPTFALPLGLWVADSASAAGAFVPAEALHGAQALTVSSALPSSGSLELSGRIDAVWDTGRSALIDIVAECEQFTATYSIILPGKGGFGGARKQRGLPATDIDAVGVTREFVTGANQAALYRLTGDRHAIHIDPVAARDVGFDRPILHGLCTLGIAAREVAAASGRRPDELQELSARFVSPVTPGDRLSTVSRSISDEIRVSAEFTVTVGGEDVLSEGVAGFQR